MGGHVFEGEHEVSLVHPEESEVSHKLLEQILEAVRKKDQAEQEPDQNSKEDKEQEGNVLVDHAFWEEVVDHESKSEGNDSEDHFPIWELSPLNINLSFYGFCFVANGVQIFSQVIFYDAPDGCN